MSVKLEEPGARKEMEEIVSSEFESESESESESEADDSDDFAFPTSGASASPSHTLEDAINSATTTRLKTVLLQMCHENAVCRYLASKALMVPSDKAEPDPKTGMKRLRKAYEVCCQCDAEYEVEENEKVKGLCVHHPGVKEVDFDSDLWADHDPNCHGEPDSFVDDPDFAEGFVWNCCGEDGDAEGCETTRHRPRKTNRVKY